MAYFEKRTGKFVGEVTLTINGAEVRYRRRASIPRRKPRTTRRTRAPREEPHTDRRTQVTATHRRT